MARCLQINLGKRHAAVVETKVRLRDENIDILFLQEPNIFNGSVRSFKGGYTLHTQGIHRKKLRSAIWLKKDFFDYNEGLFMEQFSGRDISSVSLKLKDEDGNKRSIIICSAYLPTLDDKNKRITDPVDATLRKLVNFCAQNNHELIIAADSNSHMRCWGDKNNDDRGLNLIEYLANNNLIILNKNTCPTFISGKNKSAIDITLASPRLSDQIVNWKVDLEDSGSDHRSISFTLKSEITPPTFNRIKRRTNWIGYNTGISREIKKLNLTINSNEDLDKAADHLNKIMIDAYKVNCKERTIKSDHRMDWFDNKLCNERKKLRKDFKTYKNTCKDQTIKRNILLNRYKRNRDLYRKNCKKMQKNHYRLNTSKLEKTKDISRLHKFLEKESFGKMGTLIKLDGTYTNSIEEVIHELMTTHFPDCKALDGEEDISYIPIRTNDIDNEAIEDIVSLEKINWAVNNMEGYKSPGEDGIFPALIQKAQTYIIPILQILYRQSLRLNYIPKTWRGTFVTFIPKPDKEAYGEGS